MTNINLGTVVTFKSHPYVGTNTNIIISGEHLMLAPLMVVIEIIKVVKDEHSEVDGSIIVTKGSCNCRCLWFSTKTNQFEESWLHSSLLTSIQNKVPKIDNPQELVGQKVSLITLNIELGKKKSFLTTEANSRDEFKDKSSISSLLSFIPPVMQVVEVKKNDIKDNRYDAKTGYQKKFITEYNVKCKWYNPTGEKFSEKFLPIECIFSLPKVSEETIKALNNHIKESLILRLSNSLIKPISISNRSGYYILIGYDFLENANKEFKINDKIEYTIESQLYISEAPDFRIISKHPKSEWMLINDINDIIGRSIKNSNYLRIQYKNNQDQVSIRTLKNLKLHETFEKSNQDDAAKQVYYVEGYCLLRKAIRYFKMDRIIIAQQLNIKYSLTENDSLITR